MFTRLGSFLVRHSRHVLVSSFILTIAAAFLGLGIFNQLSSSKADFADTKSDSYRVYEQVQQEFSSNAGDLVVLFTAKDGKTVDDSAVRQELGALLGKVPAGTQAVSYLSTGQEVFVSKDRTKTFANIVLSKEVDKKEALEDVRHKLRGQHVATQVGGLVAVEQDVYHQVEQDLITAESVSFVVLAILLVFVFRSLIAAMLPLLLGGVAIVGALFVTSVLTGFTDISNYAINVIIMLGLGLAIDYSLFIVGRFREELRKGQAVDTAVITTVSTAGRTVFFSGLTVILSLLGLLVFPLGFLRSISLGGVAAVLVAMVAALIMLPALLRLLGNKINALSFGSARHDLDAQASGLTSKEEKSIWYKGGTFFMRHPWASMAVVFGLLLVMGLPFLRANFGAPDYRSLPQGSEARQVSETLASDFHIQTNPILISVKADNAEAGSIPADQVQAYAQKVGQVSGVTGIESVTQSGSSALITVRYNGVPEDKTVQQAVTDIRTLEAPEGTRVMVGGAPAELRDLLDTIKRYIPYGLAVIAFTLFLLLFLMLGSVVIPLKAIIMNTLSLSAAYGALVWVFQEGHLTGLLGLTQMPALDATMPVLIFAIAFGLSMDYSVFLYSRIKEAYDKTGDSSRAVLAGLQKTGSIITSASLLLFVVVAAFATAQVPIMQQIGVGLSLTVLVDAFLVRMVLVPALMKPLGRYNWWAPKPLKRLHKKLGLEE